MQFKKRKEKINTELEIPSNIASPILIRLKIKKEWEEVHTGP